MRMKYILLTASLSLVLLAFSGCSYQAGTTSQAVSSNPASASSAASAAAVSTGEKTFTLSELKKYNGQNGSPAYVAVDGVVYDVTNVKSWQNGSHHGYSAGQDMSQAIKQSPHGTSVLSGLPVVGKLQQ